VKVDLRIYVEHLRDLPRRERLMILRGQLALIRLRFEHGIPLSVEALKRAERLACSLEQSEVAA